MHEKYLKSARWKRVAAIFFFSASGLNALAAVGSIVRGDGGSALLNTAFTVFIAIWAIDYLQQSRRDKRCAELIERGNTAFANRAK